MKKIVKFKLDSTRLASAMTDSMATWKFILVFLGLCGVEIWTNHSTLFPVQFKFDPNTIILNLILSLIAAIQGSIIMIKQQTDDAKRDSILMQTFKTQEQVLKIEKQQVKREKEMNERLARIETLLNEKGN